MIICIESWKGDTLLSGKTRPRSTLKAQLQQAQALCDPAEDNFIPLLCRMFGWEPVPFSEEIVPDNIYDRDTNRILNCQF